MLAKSKDMPHEAPLFNDEDINTVIENSFPSLEIDKIAEQESWRKEIYRPIYHIHKWWAQRLGSVFRAILLGIFIDPSKDVWENFYLTHNFRNKIILDPFMGSGTTLGEAAKLGIKPIGCDINPVSTFSVKQALTQCEISALQKQFQILQTDLQNEIQQYFKTQDRVTGKPIDVLYYFWVKIVTTPNGEEIPLFSNYVFSKNAYPSKKPDSKIVCPQCGEINTGRFDSREITCTDCKSTFDPQNGPTNGQLVLGKDGQKYKIKDLINKDQSPPVHRLYALMARGENGEKLYLRPTEHDFELYRQASNRLASEKIPLPDMPLRDGHNTAQAIGYNYKNWRDFFNDRQLLCLGLLLQRILKIEDKNIREHFICLFSSILEFNNLFCSFKGEGTGAVRHMFSNHILKPERTPLENSVWGSERASGTFSSLFKSRLIKAKEYLNEPAEVFINPADKVVSKLICSNPINLKISDNWIDFSNNENSALIINGDSGNLNIPDESVDAVVTDPPYFDFVHYSELSDFFFAWLNPALKNDYSYFNFAHSGNDHEVQDKDAERFSQGLCRVFKECWRVLKNDSLLVFSFHHSHPIGWLAIYDAVTKANFKIVAAHPVKAEMSGGSPKLISKNPINIDAILICKKIKGNDNICIVDGNFVKEKTKSLVDLLRDNGRSLSSSDCKVIAASQVLIASSAQNLASDKVLQLLIEEFEDKDNG